MTARTSSSTPASRLLTAGSALALTLGLAACGNDDADTPGTGTTNPPPVVTDPTDEPAATDTPTAEPTTAEAEPTDVPTVEEVDPGALPPFTTAGTPQTSEPSGEMLLPVDVRVGEHEGYERIVIEMTGDGVPGWRTEYVAEAVEGGRGNTIAVDGDAILSVDISGTRYPDEGEDHYAPSGPLDGDDVIEEVHYVGTFEGITQVFIGVDDGEADYRVFALAEPARLVIDVADPDD